MVKGLLGCAAGVLLVTGLTAAQEQEPLTTWSGLYTVEQADRGATLYADACAPCHAAPLSGQGPFPPVAGNRFNPRWEGRSVADLFTFIRGTMPQDEPGSLTVAQVSDLLAHLLRTGGFPAGDAPFDGGAAHLADVTFVSQKPDTLGGSGEH